MANHPINLVARFLLELAMLAALGVAGWSLGGGAWRYALAIALPLLAATLWGVFRVPNDGGAPTVQVSGRVRLLLELLLFAAGTAGLYLAGQQGWALALGALTVIHYAVSWERTSRLARNLALGQAQIYR